MPKYHVWYYILQEGSQINETKRNAPTFQSQFDDFPDSISIERKNNLVLVEFQNQFRPAI